MNAGQPSFIIQEEFDRYTGYWWQPQTKGMNIIKSKISHCNNQFPFGKKRLGKEAGHTIKRLGMRLGGGGGGGGGGRQFNAPPPLLSHQR